VKGGLGRGVFCRRRRGGLVALQRKVSVSLDGRVWEISARKERKSGTSGSVAGRGDFFSFNWGVCEDSSRVKGWERTRVIVVVGTV